MSIHRCPPEVIQQICEWLLKVSFGKYTLVALARTHPIFHEPAVNALWHTIPSVAILFWTLPQECYTRTRVPNHTQWTQFVSGTHVAVHTSLADTLNSLAIRGSPRRTGLYAFPFLRSSRQSAQCHRVCTTARLPRSEALHSTPKVDARACGILRRQRLADASQSK